MIYPIKSRNIVDAAYWRVPELLRQTAASSPNGGGRRQKQEPKWKLSPEDLPSCQLVVICPYIIRVSFQVSFRCYPQKSDRKHTKRRHTFQSLSESFDIENIPTEKKPILCVASPICQQNYNIILAAEKIVKVTTNPKVDGCCSDPEKVPGEMYRCNFDKSRHFLRS